MATLRVLSEHTGFSITTISRVLNDDPTISVQSATRAAILDAAGKLHYQSTTRPRRSAPKTAGASIAFAEMLTPVEQLSNPYYLYLKTYAQKHCKDNWLATIRLGETARGYQAPSGQTPGGILAIGIFDCEQVKSLSALSDNLVFLDSCPDPTRCDSVVLDFDLGIELGLDHLLALGHRRIGFLGPDRKLNCLKRPAPEVRRQHFIDYMKSRELFDPALLLECSMDTRSAVGRLAQSGDSLPTALLVANEETAIGAVRGLRENGLRVPQDVSIISFNDTPLSALTDPPLTSISTHVELMSETAIDLLASRIRTGRKQLPLKLVVPPALIERESVAPPRK
ncbi:MAG: LacI family DNA-binding transcriptional regulator [Oscillibacter sp.]|jgi:LacI family transcriptional regulator|nr:LacI family DNA-binding transcriptional regulator [Oscillibacter sp.]